MSPHSESSEESPEVKINLSRLGVVLGVVAALFALAGAWVVLPYRMDQVEQKVRGHDAEFSSVRGDMATMREVLIRIDENVKELKRLDRDDRRRDTRTTRTDP